jgi:hypothetical protein
MFMVAGLLVILFFTGVSGADEPKGTAFQVPYRLTETQHVLVRAKIDGKGPFNFIVDTGAPVMFVSAPVGKKLGLKADAKGWTVLSGLEIEGGPVMHKVKVRVETPFQLEGMNAMGLAGVELHGILGYTVLAKFRLEFDFTRDQMVWTLLDFSPPPPQAIGAKGANAGLEMIGAFMKILSVLAGTKVGSDAAPRGFLGVELIDRKTGVHINKLLAKAPSAAAGLQAGDVLQAVNGKTVRTSADVQRILARMLPGEMVRFAVIRDKIKKQVEVRAGEGL